MSASEQALIQSANDELMNVCLRKYGFTNPLTKIDRSQEPLAEDRRYGVWIDAVAAKYGYNLPPDPLSKKISATLQSQSGPWSDAEAKCYTRSHPLPSLSYDDSGANAPGSPISVGAAGAEEAYVYAAHTPEWTKARKDWWACMSAQGLTPRTGPTEWGPEIPADPEAALRAANIDVACKDKVNLVQRLANLEARYQAAFVDKNQATLNKQRANVEKVLMEAKKDLQIG